jgi:hypothetical protein
MKQFKLSLPHARTHHSTIEALKAGIFTSLQEVKERGPSGTGNHIGAASPRTTHFVPIHAIGAPS